jgi:hypothetical protein
VSHHSPRGTHSPQQHVRARIAAQQLRDYAMMHVAHIAQAVEHRLLRGSRLERVLHMRARTLMSLRSCDVQGTAHTLCAFAMCAFTTYCVASVYLLYCRHGSHPRLQHELPQLQCSM